MCADRVLLALLRHPSEVVRSSVSELMMPNAAIRAELENQLAKETDPGVTAALATALGRVGSEMSVAVLSDALDRATVLTALSRVKGAHRLKRVVLGEFEYPDEMEISWAPCSGIFLC